MSFAQNSANQLNELKENYPTLIFYKSLPCRERKLSSTVIAVFSQPQSVPALEEELTEVRRSVSQQGRIELRESTHHHLRCCSPTDLHTSLSPTAILRNKIAEKHRIEHLLLLQTELEAMGGISNSPIRRMSCTKNGSVKLIGST